MTDKADPPTTRETGTHTMWTFEELCLTCHADADWVARLVEHGVIDPVGTTRSDWRFASVSIVRVAKAQRLERDLGVNMPGVAVVLDLLDELDKLRARMISQWPRQ